MKVYTRKGAAVMRSVLVIVGIVILSASDCVMTMDPNGDGTMMPDGDGTMMPDGGDPEPIPVYQYPLASTLIPPGPWSLTETLKIETGAILANTDEFGRSIAFAGDLDGDGGTVLVVGASKDNSRGAIYLLSYNDAGVLQNTKKIAHTIDETNGDADSMDSLAPTLTSSDEFGTSVANAGDLYGDGNTVIAVGARGDNIYKGAIYLLSFNATGNLTGTKKIAHEIDETNDEHTLAPTLGTAEYFGVSVANAGDLDGGGGVVLAVGASGDTTGGINAGAVYLLSFSHTGNLTGTTEIGAGTAHGPSLAADNTFGNSVAHAGDLYGDGNTVLAVGAEDDTAGGTDTGAIYLLSFNATGVLQNTKKIADGLDETNGTMAMPDNDNAPDIAAGSNFGSSIVSVGDLDGGGGTVLVVGATDDDTGGTNRGAIYLLSFGTTGSLTATPEKIAHGTTGAGPELGNRYYLGVSLANAGNLAGGGGGRVLVVGGRGGPTSDNKVGELQSLHFTSMK